MAGFLRIGSENSLSEVHGTVRIPVFGNWWRRLFAFVGPAYLISVGYMDPGNWATDLEGGAQFGYKLLWVLLMSNLMAIVLQTLCAKLGLVRRRDLAQACRESYPPIVYYPLWALAEIAIVATDLAEVLGTAIGLNLLFRLPLLVGVVITAFDTLLLLLIQRWGIRRLEAVIVSLVFIVGASFVVEIFLAKPDIGEIAKGFVPSIDVSSLYVAIGMLGATVMPHNLYLHSALVQSRAVERTDEGLRTAINFNFIDTVIALNAAFFVNAAILILSSAVFFTRGIEVTEIQQAYELLAPLLGTGVASIAFGVALVAAGQSSTLTGTLAGQIVMEGFVRIKMQPWARRLLSRLLAIIPAVLVIASTGSQGTYRLLILSQVILSLQLPFAVIPLIHFTNDKEQMGRFANPTWLRLLAWLIASIVIVLNAWLAWVVISSWRKAGFWVDLIVLPVGIFLVLLLVYMSIGPWIKKLLKVRAVKPAEPKLPEKIGVHTYKKIGVALEIKDTDVIILGHAVPFAVECDAEIVLIHIVESVTAQVYRTTAEDKERLEDEEYLNRLAELLRQKGFTVKVRLGFGNAGRGVARIAKEEKLDLLILGSHGHKALADLVFGSTVSVVQHSIGDIPILVVKGT